ncbi:AAA family ATPase [Roseovarius sp. THAF8]|uniref:AAA family ATPase n=1 Tax=Roseovarius sp. THAF8 TaxID=2587846 RepID=UPI0015628BFE|nr:ATP-binding protein [Roseovarius sp. THAF8]
MDLHPRLTVLTGPNGSGKSTLLSLLEISMQPVHREPFLATPVKDKKTGKSSYSLGTLFARFNPFRRDEEPDPSANDHEIGAVSYDSGSIAKLTTSGAGALQYQVELKGRQVVVGFKIASHRATPRYSAVQSLPVSGIKPKDAFEYFNLTQSAYQRGDRYNREGKFVQNPIAPLKEALIGFAAFGADNPHMKAVPELRGLFDDFQALLKVLLPLEIGFQSLEVRTPEIVVVSKTGEFPIDSASGGLMSLIQTAWQIFLYTKAHGEKAVVLIDEPENHLHPSLQRDFLGNLVNAFPKVQFIVATHSPFVITSVKESKVYALRYTKLADEDKSSETAVTAEEIDFVSKAKTADKILDEVLGVSVTIPTWAERELSRIASNFDAESLSKDAIDKLRAELESAGLSEFLPEALGKIASD